MTSFLRVALADGRGAVLIRPHAANIVLLALSGDFYVPFDRLPGGGLAGELALVPIEDKDRTVLHDWMRGRWRVELVELSCSTCSTA